jgi:hypothetical protein
MIKLMVSCVFFIYFFYFKVNYGLQIIDLIYFMIVLIIIMIAFGVFFQSLMYHNQEFDWELLETIFFSSFLVIAGENEITSIMLNSKIM